MSHDSWSRIQARQKAGRSEDFQSVQSAAPSIVPESGYFGFEIAGGSRDICNAFVSQLKYSAVILRHTISKSGDLYIVSVRFLAAEQGAKFSKPISFKVGNQSFMALPCSLRKVEQKRNVYARLMSGDLTLFDTSRPNVVRNITTDDVWVRYIASDSNEIYVFFRERTNRKSGIAADDRWSFVSIVNGEKSGVEMMDWRDNSKNHVDIHLLRLVGIHHGGNDALSEKRIGRFERPLDPFTRPVTSQNRECVGIARGDKGNESFPRFGKNCLPIGIQALETGRDLTEEIPAGYDWVPTREQAFWMNVTIDKRLRTEYLEKQGKKSGGFGGGRKKKQIIRETETIGGF